MSATINANLVRVWLGVIATAIALTVLPGPARAAGPGFDMYDINADGYDDIGVLDTNNDRVGDVNYLDTTGNGFGDTLLMDPNQDRLQDATAYDTNGDGLLDTLDLDLDNDGLIEDRWVDADGDHLPETSVGPPNMLIGPDGSITILQTDPSLDGISSTYVDTVTGPFLDDVAALLGTSPGSTSSGGGLPGSIPGVSMGNIGDGLANAGGAMAGGPAGHYRDTNPLTGDTGYVPWGNTMP